MCTALSKLNVMLHFYIFHSFTYISTKRIIEQLQSAWKSFFNVIIVNPLNKDQVLIQVKWLHKVQHIELYTHTKRTVRYTLVVISGLKELEILLNNFLCAFLNFWHLVYTTKKYAPPDTFFQKSWTKSCTPENRSSYLDYRFYYPSGKYKLSIRSFWEYCYTIIFVVRYFVPFKRMFGGLYKHAQIPSALNLTIVFIKLCNNATFSVSFFKQSIFSPLFSFKGHEVSFSKDSATMNESYESCSPLEHKITNNLFSFFL